MTIPQPETTPADDDSRASEIFGIYDRLYDHLHCVTNVVLAPAKSDGSPDWENAFPSNLEPLEADEWPNDPVVEKRAAVIIDHVDGCSKDSSFLCYYDEADQVQFAQIAGPTEDRPIAEHIVARDLGAEPPPRKPSRLAEAAAKLAEELRAQSPMPLKLSALSDAFEKRHEQENPERYGKPPAAANDNKPQAAPKIFNVVRPADFANVPVPARAWYVDELIPARNVTLLSGDGGTGKSLLALQIAVAGCIGADAIGLAPAHGRTLVLAAEDEWDELHRRLADICCAHGTTMAALRDMRVIPAAGQDAELVRADARGRIELTNRMQALVDEIVEFEPALVVLDTSADLFGGNEIDRNQVRFFISTLRGLAMELDCAFLLLSHPSVAGMQTGTGISGSTAWNNSVRSRLYLVADKDDEDARVLRGMKANYGRKGGEIRMRWRDGVFVVDDGRPSAAIGLLNRNAEDVFKKLLSLFNRTGQNVSDVTGTNYAPAKMAKHPDAAGVGKKALADAMQRLLDSGEVKIVVDGPPSRQRKRLILTSEDYGGSRGE